MGCAQQEFLGHRILHDCVQADQGKVEAKTMWPSPTTINVLQDFWDSPAIVGLLFVLMPRFPIYLHPDPRKMHPSGMKRPKKHLID